MVMGPEKTRKSRSHPFKVNNYFWAATSPRHSPLIRGYFPKSITPKAVQLFWATTSPRHSPPQASGTMLPKVDHPKAVRLFWPTTSPCHSPPQELYSPKSITPKRFAEPLRSLSSEPLPCHRRRPHRGRRQMRTMTSDFTIPSSPSFPFLALPYLPITWH